MCLMCKIQILILIEVINKGIEKWEGSLGSSGFEKPHFRKISPQKSTSMILTIYIIPLLDTHLLYSLLLKEFIKLLSNVKISERLLFWQPFAPWKKNFVEVCEKCTGQWEVGAAGNKESLRVKTYKWICRGKSQFWQDSSLRLSDYSSTLSHTTLVVS